MTSAQLINQNSYLFSAFLVFAITCAIVLARFRRSRLAWLALVALVVILIAGNLALRNGASEIESIAQFDALLAARQPVVLEFYSNY